VTATTNTNGRARKSLAEQIDRLDAILDGLSDNLAEAVAEAVKEAVTVAVHEAVRAVLLEVLTNPALLEKVRSTLNPATPVAMPMSSQPPPEPVKGQGLAHLLNQARRWWDGLWTRAQAAYTTARAYLGQQLQQAGQYSKVVRRCRRPLLIALGVGVLAGLVVWLTGPWLAPVAGWVAGFVTALGVQTVIALRRLPPSLAKAL
jgi:hypothetical protein